MSDTSIIAKISMSLNTYIMVLYITIKHVVSRHSKHRQNKDLMTKCSLMKIESFAESIIGLENQLLVFLLSGRLRQVLLDCTRDSL